MAKKQRLYGSIEFYKFKDKDFLRITQMEPHVCIRLKQLFPKIPQYASVPFFLDDNEENCNDLVWFMQRYPLGISAKDERRLKLGKKAFDLTQNEMERILRTPNYEICNATLSLKDGQALRPYQQQAIGLLWLNEVLICGDDLGLGKSYTGIGSLLRAEALPAAVVVQTHLPKQWWDKFTEFSNFKVHVVKTKKPYNLPEADAYVFKYSSLAGWVDIFKTGFFKAAIFDEIQEIRRGTVSEKGIAAETLCENVKYKFGLSATPMYNFVDEIFNIYDILQKGILGSRDDFEREWGASTRIASNKCTVKDPKALGAYLRERGLFIRRTKEDVNQQIPPINKIVETVDYDEHTVIEIEELAKSLAIRTLHSESFMERGQAARELDMLMRHTTGVSKARYVAQYARIFLENEEPIVLCGWHRDVYDIWAKELEEFNPVFYTGTESAKQKEESKRKFVEGETNLFIISLRSGAGLDGLQHRCSTIIHGELDWSPQVHEQLTGRLYREGQQNPVMSIYLTSDYGSDPDVINLLGLKASQAKGILDPFSSVESVMSDTSRIAMLAQKILKQKRVAA